MDITSTLEPKSDQLDACELPTPRTFTITKVAKGSTDEQPVQVWFAEFPRPWRPSKGMRRVLAAAWTPMAQEWVGRRVTLYCDTDVRFGGIEVGGIRISHLSDLEGPKKVPLLVSKGKSSMFTVQPLVGDPALSKAQSERIGALLREHGIADKARALALYFDAIGREVNGTKDLTAREADLVVAALEQMTPPADDQPRP